MRVISRAELQGDTQKYLDLASTEQILVKGDNNETFELVKRKAPKQPDADYYRSISVEEFRARAHKMIEEMYKLPR